MIAIDEKEQMTSCLNRALPHEIVFTLLGRDRTAPAVIRFWCEERVRLGNNEPNDQQIIGALSDAEEMEKQYATIRQDITSA